MNLHGPAEPSAPADAAALQALAAPSLAPAYRRHDSLFSSPWQRLHARGTSARLQTCAEHGLADAAERLLARSAAEAGGLPLLGAVPFERSQPARLWLPGEAVFAAGDARHRGAAGAIGSSAGSLASSHTRLPARPAPCVSACPDPAQFKRNVEASLARIRAGEVDKVVMSRSLRIDAPVDVPALLSRLLARAPGAYTFAMDLDGEGAGAACLVGSSPELLLSKRGARIVSNPLAGSIPRHADPGEDQRRAQALLASAKDRHEHALVVQAVAAALAPHCRALQVPDAPSLVATPTLWHLSTRVDGWLADPAASSLRLALALHPTPAVCGHPTAPARRMIRELEGYDRGLFTGLVGWCDSHGDGEWAVTIRCALVEAQSATLFAGAGIVAGSDPQAELAETSAKLATLLGALGWDTSIADAGAWEGAA